MVRSIYYVDLLSWLLDARHMAARPLLCTPTSPGKTRDTINRNAAVAGVTAGIHLHINVVAVCVAWLPRMI